MKRKSKIAVALVAVGVIVGGVTYANGYNPRQSVEFYTGHTHDADGTHGAPGHSGGTDRYGCHNGSVPYHCH